ncbi:SUKH-4 family immunity protein [Streptomyces sp. NPDC001948]
MVSRERLVEVFGEDTVLLSAEAVPEELRRQSAGQTLMRSGLPRNLLDAVSSVPDLEEGVKTYSEHCEEVGVESDDRIRSMYRIGFAGSGDILVDPATGDVYYADPEVDIIRRINTSVDKYVEDLCTLEAERERFDFLDEEDVAIQREELSDVLRESDEASWSTASLFWRWIIEQISADDYRVF